MREPKWLPPHRLGWLRRKELDTETEEVWEMPDGKLFAHSKEMPPLQVTKLPNSP
jgi:hypothetical protein